MDGATLARHGRSQLGDTAVDGQRRCEAARTEHAAADSTDAEAHAARLGLDTVDIALADGTRIRVMGLDRGVYTGCIPLSIETDEAGNAVVSHDLSLGGRVIDPSEVASIIINGELSIPVA